MPTIAGGPDFDENRALAQDHKVSVDIGIRAAGQNGEQQAADYIRNELALYGYEAHEQPFSIQIYQGFDTSLQNTDTGHSFNANPMTYSASADAEGEAVFVAGLGNVADFPAETAGRVVVIHRGTLPFAEKVENAEAAGAIGVVIFNNESGPFTATLRAPSSIPAVTISQDDGVTLKDQIAVGVVHLKVSVHANISTGESRNVLAQAPRGGDCKVIIGGHYDSVPAGPGANDNGSGTAVAIEMARALAVRGETAGVCVALFGSEEAGLLGSQYYVSQLTDAQKGAIVGYLNFDMLAVGDQWPVVGTSSLTTLAIQQAAAIGVTAYEGGLPANVGSDHASFINAGIPAILFNCFCDPNYHTAADRYEFIVADRLKVAGQIGLGMVEALLGPAA